MAHGKVKKLGDFGASKGVLALQMGELLQSLIAGEASAGDQPAGVAQTPGADRKGTPQKAAEQHGAADVAPSTSEVIDCREASVTMFGTW